MMMMRQFAKHDDDGERSTAANVFFSNKNDGVLCSITRAAAPVAQRECDALPLSAHSHGLLVETAAQGLLRSANAMPFLCQVPGTRDH